MKKEKIVCPRCGSDDVVADAFAVWDVETQDWTLLAAYDSKICQTCGYESDSFDSVEVE